jgi:hypothetical protein
LVVIALASFRFASLVGTASCVPPAGNKKAAAREALARIPQTAALLRVVRHWTAQRVADDGRFRLVLFKLRAKSAVRAFIAQYQSFGGFAALSANHPEAIR